MKRWTRAAFSQEFAGEGRRFLKVFRNPVGFVKVLAAKDQTFLVAMPLLLLLCSLPDLLPKMSAELGLVNLVAVVGLITYIGAKSGRDALMGWPE